MKKNYHFLILLFAGLSFTFFSCSNQDDDNLNKACLSPSASYFKMDGSPADTGTTTVVFQSNNGYTEFRYSVFSGLINSNLLELTNVRMNFRCMQGSSFVTSDINLMDSIAEGGCMQLSLRLFSEIAPNTKCAFLQLDTREKRPTPTGTNTDEYHCDILGDIFVSKVGGKLRFTSDGTLNATNRVNGVVLHTVNFSGLSDESF